jgi:uncharacterized membrane protein YkvA (DUF1232 family)
MSWLGILLCILYVLSPFDFVPDFIPVVGWLDDVGVLGYMAYCLINSEGETAPRS